VIIAEVDFSVFNRDDRELYCTITASPDLHRAPMVLMLHGFKGFRNWGFFPMAAQEVAQHGFIVVRMDFALNGMRGTNNTVISLADFGENTITHEVDDVHDVIDGMLSNPELSWIREQWNRHVHFVGHSRGGAITQIAASELRTVPDVTVGKSVVWNTIGNADRWSHRQRDIWREVGYMEVENTRTGQTLRMDSSFLDDLEENSERLSLPHAATSVQDLMMYIHSDSDLTVNIREVKELLSSIDSKAKLVVIPGSTHTFGISHPLERITDTFAHVLQRSIDHIKS